MRDKLQTLVPAASVVTSSGEAICVNTSLALRGTKPSAADIPRRLRIRSRHRQNPSVTYAIVNTCPDVGILGRRPSPRVHDGVESGFTLARIGNLLVPSATGSGGALSEPVLVFVSFRRTKPGVTLNLVALGSGRLRFRTFATD